MIDASALDALLGVLRKHGVSHYADSEFQLDLEPRMAPELLAKIRAIPEPTPDDILFHSSPLGPPPEPGFQPIPADEQPKA